MALLNPRLFQQLEAEFGTGQVGNEGTPGTYELPPPKTLCCASREKRRLANVTGWGEIYKFNCPFCDDKDLQRFRLVFSHLFGASATEDGKNVVSFSRHLVRCHNEHCHMRPDFRRFLEERGIGYDVPGIPILLTEATKAPEKKAFRAFLGRTIDLPPNTVPLTSGNLPGFVYSYLAEREWDVQELADVYGCRFGYKGTSWTSPMVRMDATNQPVPHIISFEQDRLVIPIIQGRRLVGWQARKFNDEPQQKYLNPPDLPKSDWLYNYDRALFYPTVVVCEGVADVWRVGENAVALFGHSLSPRQQELMKLLWGVDGRCLLLLDHDADAEADEIVDRLRKAQVFPRGVMKVPLQDDRDPGALPRSYLQELLTWAEGVLETQS